MDCNNNASSTKFLEDMMQGDIKPVYEPFLKKMPEKGLILDVGCGSGRDSLYFKEMGHVIVPMDTSAQNCQLAGERIGQAVLFCRFQDVHFKVPFDGIWSCGSLTHLVDEELVSVLSNLHCYLKSNGVLCTSFIYTKEQRDKEKVKTLLEEAGYKVDQMWITQEKNSSHVNRRWLNVLAN